MDDTRLTISRVIWRLILSWPWNVGQRSVTQGHWNWCHSIRLNFYSRPNYGAILYRLRNIATYWYKIAKSLYPSCILCPCREWPHRNFVKMFDAGKTRMIGRPYGEKTVTIRYAVFIWYRSVTGRQTDVFAISISRVSVLTRDKNVSAERVWTPREF